ncbi:phage holin family protein [soil metagenome]|jgi:uncharacterized membrane protein YqjE|nr:phage holin family protein [Acidimicrobiia bacterium]MBA3955321.1 phage holin family protein [Acidimicrobiia bacterium]MDQ3462779.1 phage holin family protein [Actinomycetota bacterium]
MAQTRTGYRDQTERSTQDLLSDFGSQVGALLRQEVELAKIETKEQLTRAGKAGAMFGAAGVAGFMALLLISFAAAWGLAAVLPDGLAFLIVGIVYAVAAAILLASGRKKAKGISVVPQQTVQTLKEDAQWARAQRK